MDTNIFVLLCYVLTLGVNGDPRYRTDYTYNPRTDAFYKLHIESERSRRAAEICQFEGAKLMVPSSHLDIAQAHLMFKEYPDLGDYIYVGDDGSEHESAEEQPLINLETEADDDYEAHNSEIKCDVITRAGEIESFLCFRSLPFICKVEAKDSIYNRQCDVYGIGYVYNSTVGSCYKISKIPMTWNRGYSECKAEGSHLAVINSEKEHVAIWNLLKAAPALEGSRFHWFYFIGFRANKVTDGSPRVFKTIFNETLDEAGFNVWSENEPSNTDGVEDCGSIFKNNGKLNDLNCDQNFGVVCEKEVHT